MATFRQLEYFVAVVDDEGFTDAARRLGVTQPGLSHQLKSLEASLGGLLLRRTSSGPQLTPLGRAVLPLARAVVADVAALQDVAARVREGHAGSLSVGTIYSLSLGVLPEVFRVWREQRPGVIVTLHEYNHADTLIEAVLAGHVDVAISPVPDDVTLATSLVGVEPFVVIVPPGHRFTSREEIDLAELSDDDWVHFAPQHGLSRVLEEQAARRGFCPRVAMRTTQTAATVGYVAAGIGAALVPANMIPSDFPGGVLRPSPRISRTIHLVARDPNDLLIAEFSSVVLSSAQLGPPRDRRCQPILPVSDEDRSRRRS